ncbi:hypothetical protein Avbf_12837 [Armadillidium vulgare]|nr:hypothetical protein Avbf_12837 [Armadillidium vulgare]
MGHLMYHALEEIKVARRKASEDPLGFVELLQNGEINFRPRINVAENNVGKYGNYFLLLKGEKCIQVPEIDMSKYDITSYIESMRPITRKSTRETSFASVSVRTRTLMQVQSRVQKYFIALKKEGLPVPGRDPKTAMLRNTRKRAYCNHVSASTKFMKAFDFGDSAEHNTELSSIMENEKDQSNTSKIPDPTRPRLSLKRDKATKT